MKMKPLIDHLVLFQQTGDLSCDPMSGRPLSSMGSGILSLEEKKFLLAVERGDVASTRRFVINNHIIMMTLPRKEHQSLHKTHFQNVGELRRQYQHQLY